MKSWNYALKAHGSECSLNESLRAKREGQDRESQIQQLHCSYNHHLAVCCSGITCTMDQGCPGESKDSSLSRVQWGRVSEAQERFVQMSRIAFAETPNSAESSAAECFVLVLPWWKMWMAKVGVNLTRPKSEPKSASWSSVPASVSSGCEPGAVAATWMIHRGEGIMDSWHNCWPTGRAASIAWGWVSIERPVTLSNSLNSHQSSRKGSMNGICRCRSSIGSNCAWSGGPPVERSTRPPSPLSIWFMAYVCVRPV